MRKKGSAHLEIILSFVIFVGFTAFLLSYLQPIRNANVLEESVLSGFEEHFWEKAGTVFEKVLLNSTAPCKPSELSYNSLQSSEVLDNGFFYIISSPEFDSSLLASCNQSYKLGFLKNQTVLSNKSLSSMESQYNSDYESLKTELGIPSVIDFAVISDEYNMERDISSSSEVRAKEYSALVVYSNGTIETKSFIFKIWK